MISEGIVSVGIASLGVASIGINGGGDDSGGGGPIGEGGTLIALGDWSTHGVAPPALPGYEGTFWFQYGGINSVVSDQLQMDYPDTSDDGYINAGLTFFPDGLNLQEVYIQFDVILPDSSPQGGCKFCKIAGINNSPSGYSNTTYQLEENKLFDHISFGDGTTVGNDVAQVINYDGAHPEYAGRNDGLADIYVAGSSFTFDTSMHRVRIKHRYNSGTTLETETNDGEYYVEVDGVVYLHATGIYNRHYTNSLYIEQIMFGGVVQNDPPLRILWDSVKISTDGFISD